MIVGLARYCLSLPVQGAWIEMHKKRAVLQGKRSLPVQGAWIEMSLAMVVSASVESLPVQGAWIEMALRALERASHPRRSPCRERGLKYGDGRRAAGAGLSLPVQGAWIEIFRGGACASPSVVAPRAGSVD